MMYYVQYGLYGGCMMYEMYGLYGLYGLYRFTRLWDSVCVLYSALYSYFAVCGAV